LAVVEVWVDHCVCRKYLPQVVSVDASHGREGSIDVNVDSVFDIRWQFNAGLPLQRLELVFDLFGVDLKNLKPQNLSLLINSLLIRTKERLL